MGCTSAWLRPRERGLEALYVLKGPPDGSGSLCLREWVLIFGRSSLNLSRERCLAHSLVSH